MSGITRSVIVRVAGIVFSLAVSLGVFLVFSPAMAGLFFMVINGGIIVSAAIRLGYDNVLLKEYAKSASLQEPNENGLFLFCLKNVTLVFLLVLALGWFLQLLFSSLQDVLNSQLLLLALLLAYVSALNSLTAELIKGLHRVNRAILLQSVVPHLFPLLALTIPGLRQLAFILGAYIFGYACALITGLASAQTAWSFKRPSLAYRREINSQSKALYTTMLVLMVASHLDLLLIGFWHSAEAVAGYALVSKLGLVFSIILSFFNSVYSPGFSRNHNENNLLQLRKALRTSSILMAIIGAGLFVLVIVLAPVVFPLINPGYDGLEWLIACFALAGLIQLATGQSAQLMIMTNHIDAYRRLTVSVSVLGILLNLLLIPYYGVMAAALIYLVTVAIKNIAGALMARKLVGVSVYG